MSVIKSVSSSSFMRFYKFDEFKIDVSKRKFFCNGQEIELRDRDFDVLLFLVENRHETQSKDKIIKKVWEGTIVEDNSVERAIVNIRKVLGDDASNPWFIKTVRNKGYLFLRDVEELNTEKPINKTPHLNQTHTSYDKSNFRLIPALVSLILFVGILVITLWNIPQVFAYLTTETVFNEDFSSETLDTNKWKFEGNSVKVTNGVVRISVDKFRNGGKLKSGFFKYNSDKPLTIKSRVRISYNQSIRELVRFIGAFGLLGNEPSEKDFLGIKYANAEVKFQREGKVTTEGFYLVKNDADLLDERSHCSGNIGPRTEAIWGDWFEQMLIYEPTTKTVKYFINNKKKGEFLVEKLPATKDNKLRLNIYPSGAFLHHAIEIDYIKITQ